MTLRKAKREADKMSRLINQDCYVIKLEQKAYWYLPSTWFKYTNVSRDYIDFKDYRGKIYYTTK